MKIYESIREYEVGRHIAAGDVGILPTDTLYGLVCAAGMPDAVKRLYGLKHRERKPGTIIAANIEQLEELGIKRRYLTAAVSFWPGPVSVVVPAEPSLLYLHQGLQSLAVRIPAHESLRMLLETSGPLLTSSANPPGQEPAVNVEQATAYFDESIDFYVDGGDLSDSLPSTVIRVVDDAVEVLRLGAFKIDDQG